MKITFFSYVLIIIALSACNPKHLPVDDHAHEEEVKFQYTVYTDHFELFAEADPFLPGEPANVLSHFSALPGFKAVETGEITIILEVNGQEVRQTLDKPTRRGIYSFDITPTTAGKGILRFDIKIDNGSFEVPVPEVIVFNSIEEAKPVAEKQAVSKTNTTVFTKEQSWKIEFETGFPGKGPFGQVIKTSARVLSSPKDESVITSMTEGVMVFLDNDILEGDQVAQGQRLFTVSASSMAEDNLGVRYTEARNNYEKARAEYDRKKELAKDRIVSEKDLIAARTDFENAKAAFELLDKNLSSGGYAISSPISGFVRHIYVTNGQYVSAGQPVVMVAKDNTLLLKAELQQKYVPFLHSISTVTIKTVPDNKMYAWDELNGRILSIGRSTGDGNYLIPLNLEINNPGNMLTGSFVELYIRTATNTEAVTVPDAALMEDQGAYFAFVQVTPELFEKREVVVGQTDGFRTEILSGISSDERIITRGAIFVRLAQATGALDAHSGHNH